MSGRRRKGLSPSLFPFLAVLVCTLGTLILLLALVAQTASTSAQAKANADQTRAIEKEKASEPELTGAQADALIDEGEFRVEQLVSFRDQQTADLEQRRSQMTQVEAHMAKIRKQLQQLNSEVELATSEKDIEPVDHAELLTLKQRLIQEEKSVNKLRADKSDQIPRVALIPHKGPNGTDRRPVYLECTPQGLTIWPEGAAITAGQLEESVTGANPLDDALRVVRHHAMHQYGDAVPPYPLLVVRPGGIETYAAARIALRDWDDQFGYELVPAAVKLAYDKPNAQLKQQLDETIRAAIIKQHGLNALARRAGGKSNFSADGRRVYPRLSAASMDRAGRESGFQDHRESFSRRNLRSVQQNASRTYSSHAGSHQGADVARALDEKLKNAAQEIRNGQGSYGAVGDYARNPYAALGNQPSDGRNAQSERAGNAMGTQPMRTQIDKTDLEKISQNASEPESDLADSAKPSAGPRANGYMVPTPGPNDALGHQYNPHINGEMGLNAASNSQPNSSGQISARQRPRNSSSGNSNYSNSLANSVDGNQQGSGAKANASKRSSNIAPSQSPPTDSQTASQSSSQTRRTNQNQSATREMVQRKGADWALPQSLAHSSGNSIIRTMRVKCYSDRLVLLGSLRGDSMTEVFEISDKDMNQASLELASAVRDRIEQWGAALPGGRWQPRLEVEVMPGSSDRFYQLQRMMSGGGVEIQGRLSQ